MMFERVTTFTPLGIRFWDSALDRQVSDHLQVKAYPVNGHGTAVNAFRSASGVYAFQGLPGMREIETGDSDGIPAVPPSGKKSFIIETSDGLGRFLPVVFKAELPLPYLGVYLFEGTGGTAAPGLYLFSAPSRTVPPGLAVVRANLVEKTTGNPAPHAVMEVQVEGEDPGVKWYGIADEKGGITILFPYPSIQVSLSASPPGGPSVLLADQQWQLTLQVRFAPTELKYSANRAIPLLDSILNQPAGKIWGDSTGPAITQWSETLTFGQELLLNTIGAGKAGLSIEAA